MTILTTIFSLITSDIKTTLISLIIGFIVYKIARFYAHFYSLPPGPIPVPLLGNILYFRGIKEHWSIELEKLPKKYGQVYTFYPGGKPLVFIRDIDIAREAFRKNDFAGRPDTMFEKLLTCGKGSDVTFGDYGHSWEALRRVAHSAVMKYAPTDKFLYLATDCVDHTINNILKTEGLNKPFVPFDHLYHLFLNILSASAFGKRYEFDDKEFKQIKYVLKDYGKELGNKILYYEFIPIYRRIDKKGYEKLVKIFVDMNALVRKKFINHYSDYSDTNIRDFCDALISAKNEALIEGKESVPYLTDNNLALAVFDVFFAGIDTSYNTFRYLLLLSLYYPKIGQKLRQEIESEIGDRMPTHEDRNRCHYVMAFISETIRLKNPAPNGLFHKAVVTSKIGDYTIPKDTGIVVCQSAIMKDEKYWTNPHEFNPDRFLENGEYIKTRPSAFIPFGVGRRVCLGEKLAIADLFLVLVRFIQRTNEYDITLHSHNGIDPDPNMATGVEVKEYEIILKRE